MKRFLITFALSIALVLAMCVTSFAFELHPELGDGYGCNYNTDHESSDCCPFLGESFYGSHYDEGYYTGYKDGLASTDITDEEKQAIIQEYLTSQAFQAAMAQAVEDYKASDDFKNDIKNSEEYLLAIADSYIQGMSAGAEDYKNSDAYDYALSSEYQAGVNAGYSAGYSSGYGDASEALYDKGVADGYVNFRESVEYSKTLQSQYDGGYSEGYTDAVEDVNSIPNDEGVDYVKIFSLIAGVLFSGFVLLLVLKFKNKKRR